MVVSRNYTRRRELFPNPTLPKMQESPCLRLMARRILATESFNDGV